MSNMQFRSFIAGLLACSAGRSLLQDCYGKESYIKLVEAGWLSAAVTVPMALVVLVAVVGLLVIDIKDEP